MITFSNEKQIEEWMVDLENHLTLLKANLACDKRKCTVVDKTTDGFAYKHEAKKHIECVRSCASMVGQYLGV
jgi:hypothetical protein